VLSIAEILALSPEDYRTVLEQISERGIVGGATYDALIAHTAAKAQADKLVTLNPQDFQRVYPLLSERIVAP
jgi:predicted nucleic acid-binding protein